jgi:hypothetical protein
MELIQNAQTSLPSIPASEGPEFAALVEILGRNGERSIGDLVKVIDKAWPKPKAPQKKKTAVVTPVDQSVWVAKLQRARGDAPAFEALLIELAKSKQLKLADVVAIANGFRSTTKVYRAKSAAVEDIRKSWMQEQRDNEKARKADDIF